MPLARGGAEKQEDEERARERRGNIHEKVKYYRLNGDDGSHALTDKICVSPPTDGKRENVAGFSNDLCQG